MNMFGTNPMLTFFTVILEYSLDMDLAFLYRIRVHMVSWLVINKALANMLYKYVSILVELINIKLRSYLIDLYKNVSN